jgi:hypothetical protein
MRLSSVVQVLDPEGRAVHTSVLDAGARVVVTTPQAYGALHVTTHADGTVGLAAEDGDGRVLDAHTVVPALVLDPVPADAEKPQKGEDFDVGGSD